MNVVLDCHNDRPAIAFADFKKNARPDCGGHASALQVIEPAKNANAAPVIARNESVALRLVDVDDPTSDRPVAEPRVGRVLRFRLMINVVFVEQPQASDGEAQHET
ncbi:hypothetical protein, partial [Bradyrhizobium japonicum]